MEFKDFTNFIEQKEQYAKIPNSSKEALIKLLGAKTCMTAALFLPKLIFDVENLDTPTFYEANLVTKIFYCYFAMLAVRCGYYVVW